jgi:hypothetical protein
LFDCANVAFPVRLALELALLLTEIFDEMFYVEFLVKLALIFPETFLLLFS